MRKVDIVIPIYKPELSPQEQFNLDQSLKTLKAYKQTFIAPYGLDVSYYARRYVANFQFFEQTFFSSVLDYSRLLVNQFFYETFSDTEFILIIQSDVYVFHDDLPYWLNRGIDYVGAPWPNGIELNVQVGKFARTGGKATKVFVGNGGFSLRRRQACIDLIKEHQEIADWFVKTGSNEDLFFSLIGSLSDDFLIPNQIMASRFALELNPEHYMAINSGKLPMAVHAYEKHNPDFWRSYIPACPI
jgi:hypothetical protein